MATVKAQHAELEKNVRLHAMQAALNEPERQCMEPHAEKDCFSRRKLFWLLEI